MDSYSFCLFNYLLVPFSSSCLCVFFCVFFYFSSHFALGYVFFFTCFLCLFVLLCFISLATFLFSRSSFLFVLISVFPVFCKCCGSFRLSVLVDVLLFCDSRSFIHSFAVLSVFLCSDFQFSFFHYSSFLLSALSSSVSITCFSCIYFPLFHVHLLFVLHSAVALSGSCSGSQFALNTSHTVSYFAHIHGSLALFWLISDSPLHCSSIFFVIHLVLPLFVPQFSPTTPETLLFSIVLSFVLKRF